MIKVCTSGHEKQKCAQKWTHLLLTSMKEFSAKWTQSVHKWTWGRVHFLSIYNWNTAKVDTKSGFSEPLYINNDRSIPSILNKQ